MEIPWKEYKKVLGVNLLIRIKKTGRKRWARIVNEIGMFCEVRTNHKNGTYDIDTYKKHEVKVLKWGN